MDNKSGYQDEERMRILRMVEDGAISPGEAASLLDAMSRHAPRPSVSSDVSSQVEEFSQAPGGPRWFKVRVTELSTGRKKTTVNIPLGLMEWGLRIGAQFAPEVNQYHVRDLMRSVMEDGQTGKLIDVEDDEDDEHVEIYIE